MLKKTITYTDFNDNERTEDFYFNLTETELTELDLSHEGGLVKRLQDVIAASDSATIMQIFKGLLLKSYGVKSQDGRKFIKNQELRDDFEQTQAYNDFFMELSTDADKAVEFVKGIIPKALSAGVDTAEIAKKAQMAVKGIDPFKE